MAPSIQNIPEEEEDDTPLRYKRRRFTQPDSQSQRPVQRFRSQIVQEELIDDFISIDSDNSEQSEQDNHHNLDLNLNLDDDDDDDDLIPNIVTNKSSLINNVNGGSLLRLMLSDPEVLECPVCLDQLLSPVFQCENGHIACNSCYMKMKGKCPFRCTEIGYNYNHCRGLEKCIESISKISCKYANLGCKKMIPYGKKSEHEQMCPYATVNCPFSSCQFADCSKNVYRHFSINHADFTMQFTYDETFLVDIDMDQSHIYLQEENENVIFILKHDVLEHGRVFNVDCVGSGSLNNLFRCEITLPFEYADHNEVMLLSVCIMKVGSSEFDVYEDDDEEFNFVNGSVQVVIKDFDALVCSICSDPLSTPVFQCQIGGVICSPCCSNAEQSQFFNVSNKVVYQRCRGLERILESVSVSCKNAKDGCEETMTYSTKRKHEQMCLYSTCFCPQTSCPFYGSYKDVYIHFDIAHSAYAFTYNTRFSVCVDMNQKHVFLQEQNEGAVFVVNQEVREHERAFNVEYVGSSTFKKCLKYQLSAKRLETSYSLETVPQMFIKGAKHSLKKNCLKVPFEFAGDNGLLSVFVTIIKE
ncbi:uncharacterized protein [Rutidosis leptorrhynchoides]|uniref:uncharacterized protein n=1 Tax=Rutidosis leptorrhynchoides TaxID=125765 RepID=UPI003A991111